MIGERPRAKRAAVEEDRATKEAIFRLRDRRSHEQRDDRRTRAPAEQS